jgi:hypothetical protein
MNFARMSPAGLRYVLERIAERPINRIQDAAALDRK